jgi:Flp pilus assembly protein TadD
MTMRALLFLVIAAVSALPACKSATPLAPQALALNRDGVAALAAGDLATAEARFALAIEYDARFTEAQVNAGLVELRRGNFEEARHHFAKAVDLNPDLPVPHHSLGLLLELRGEPREAEAHYHAALKVDPGFAPSRLQLGRCLFARGAYDDAEEQFLRATQVAPTAIDAWVGLGEALLKLERVTEADATLANARARFGDDAPELGILIARQALREGDTAKAEAALEGLRQHADPLRRAAAWAWTGVARLTAGDVLGAAVAADQALALDREQSVAAYVGEEARRAGALRAVVAATRGAR